MVADEDPFRGSMLMRPALRRLVLAGAAVLFLWLSIAWSLALA